VTVLGIAHSQLDSSNVHYVEDLGCKEIYEPFLWCNVQPKKNVWNWEHYDQQFAFEEEHGIRSVRFLTHTPHWCSGVDPRDCKYPVNSYPPRSLLDFEVFVRALVKRYPGREWCVWAEPDNHPPRESDSLVRWASTAKIYGRMLQVGYESMKEIDSTCRVGMGGLVGATLNGAHRQIVHGQDKADHTRFFDTLLYDGADRFCDFIPLDLFCYGYGGVRNFIVGFRKIREIMHKHGVAKPIWVSETGAKITRSGEAPGEEDFDREYFNHQFVTEQTLAGYMLYAYRTCIELNIEKMFWVGLVHSERGLINRRRRKLLTYDVFKMIQLTKDEGICRG